MEISLPVWQRILRRRQTYPDKVFGVERFPFFSNISDNPFLITNIQEVFVKKVLTAVLGIFLLSSLAITQTQRLAYVDSETILGQLKEAQDAKAAVDDAVKQWQDELDQMGKDLDSSLQDYQSKQALYSPQKKEEEQKRLTQMQQRIRDLQLQRQQDAAQLRDKKFQPIREKVLKAIEAVAKEEGFTFVFDKLDTQSALLYADVKYDLTWKVIDRLKRGPSSSKGK